MKKNTTTQNLSKYLHMKHVVLLLFVAATLWTCHRDQTIWEPIVKRLESWGTISADKNGNTWNPDPYADLNNKFPGLFNLGFIEYNESDLPVEECSIFKIPLKIGKYPINYTEIQTADSLVGTAFFFTEADLILGYYDVRSGDSTNFIELESYDPDTKEVKGRFEIKLYPTHLPYPGAPDSIVLKNGVFHTRFD